MATVERLYATILRPHSPDAILLLGAGASLKSGIPLAADLVHRAVKWAYCRTNGRHPDDPTAMRSDWLPWLQGHSWYRADSSPAENYSPVLEHLLQPREERKEFLLRVLAPGVPPSSGYKYLVELMAERVVKTVLTTNFDSVLPDLCHTHHRPHHVEVVRTPADYIKLTTSPRYPQIVYLHGAVENYTDLNLVDETQRLDTELVRRLVPLLRDHPLVVIGYRGAEPSVMRHLLMEQAAEASYFRHGIFWCVRRSGLVSRLHPLVGELAALIDGNFQAVEIDGFDELLDQLRSLHEQSIRQTPSTGSAYWIDPAQPAPTSDMQPVVGATLDDLDWPRIQTQMVDYCQRMAIAVPGRVSREWLIAQMCDLDLAIRANGQVQLTTAGYLLFGQRPHERVRAAQVLLRLSDEPEQVLDGNLWSQLDAIMEALDEVNRPFRLKGTVSETVYPYPVLALKELVVNALVHRSYEGAQRLLIEIEPTHIRIVNPGGLVDEVSRKVSGLPLQAQIERGVRGIKGYRNPVIADVFYGAGAMDKAGSGLADVQTWVKDNGGKVTFGPTRDNSAFDVTVYRRPEAVDEVTGTASPLVTTVRYAGNILEVVELPPVVWQAGTPARRAKEVWEASGADWLPPFILQRSRLVSFADLRDPMNPLISQIDQDDVGSVSLEEFASSEDGERWLVYLFNECLYRLLDTRGLFVDKKRKRSYFPRTETGPREVTYQARLRRATRTVTKPVVSKTTRRVLYWEHEAIRFGFERFGDAWTLQILPGYVFTVDGWRRLVEGPKVGPLAARRAARDYNAQVHNDLVFWSWVLADGRDFIELGAGLGSRIVLRASLATCEVRDLPLLPDVIEPELDARARAEEEVLVEELAKLAEEAAGELEESDEPEA